MCEHIAAAFLKEQEETIYKHYMAEALRIISGNTSHHVIPGYGTVDYGASIQKSWLEVSGKTERKQTPKMTAEEIAADVIRRAGLTSKEEPENG